MIDPTIADRVSVLLADSAAAHLLYRQAVPHTEPGAVPGTVVKTAGDPIAAKEALQRAADLRREAHALDPDRTAPAWEDHEPTHPHDLLLEFYSKELAAL